MLDERSFSELVDEIVAQGFDEKTAVRYAVLIGDRPIVDEKGKLVVMSAGEVIAKLEPLRMFEG